MDLTEVQWRVIEPLLPPEQTQAIKRRGRPWREARAVLNGILWIMRTGAQWDELPKKYPPYQTCHRRFQQWVMDGSFEKILREIARDLHERGGIDVSECFIDGSFAGAKKGAFLWEKRSEERGQRSWPLQTAMVFLSPLPSTAPLLTKSPSSKTPSKR
jgi:transposase